MSNRRSYKKIPEELRGKLIAITAIEPGAGKSYSKEAIVKELEKDNFKVHSLGTTQIVSQHQTLCSYLRLYNNKTNEFRKYEEVRKVHSKTHAFIFIDEAWMMCQELVDALKEDFPKCCIVLIGDPSQLEGVDTTTNGKSVINNVDINIELQGSHRTSDKDLLSFMHELKAGRINFDLLKTRIRPTTDEDMVITYTHNDKNTYNNFKEFYHKEAKGRYFYSMTGEVVNGKLRFHKADKAWTDSWKNMELWRVTDISAGGEFNIQSITDSKRSLSNMPLDIFNKYFYNADSINIHKVQGVSLKDTKFTIWPYDSNFKGSYTSVLRQLYVMVSRASSWDNIAISQEKYDDLYNKYHNHLSAPLSFNVAAQVKVTSTSDILSSYSSDDFLKLLQTRLSEVSPSGVSKNFVSLSKVVIYNARDRVNLRSFNVGTRKSGGRGNKRVYNLTRSEVDCIISYLKRHNGQINPSWTEDKLEYANDYLSTHPELNKNKINVTNNNIGVNTMDNTMVKYDKYDEIINNDIDRDIIFKNIPGDPYPKHIISLENEYNAILDDILGSIDKNIPCSCEEAREKLRVYLNNYYGKNGLHIVYVYENFNVNLAKHIFKNEEPDFVYDEKTNVVKIKHNKA